MQWSCSCRRQATIGAAWCRTEIHYPGQWEPLLHSLPAFSRVMIPLIHQNQVEKVRRKLVEPSVLFPRNLLDVGDGDTAVPEVIQVDPTAFDDRHFGKFGRAFS